MADLILPAQVEASLEILMEYLWVNEKPDYLTCSLADKDRHIYKEVMVVERWMEKVRAVDKTVCRELSHQQVDHAGGCPRCANGRHDGAVAIGRTNWFFCRIHRLKWCVGSTMAKSWRETAQDWKAKYDTIVDFEEIEPTIITTSVQSTVRPRDVPEKD